MPPVIHEQKVDWLMCHKCGSLQTVIPVSADFELHCGQCGNKLHVGHGAWLDPASALALTGLILFLIANAFPFLYLKIAGFSQGASILTGVVALYEHKAYLLATTVFVTIFVFPLFEILVLLYLLIPYRLNRRLPGQITLFRWLVRAQPWSMMEIFLLAVLVTSVKLGDMARVIPGVAMYAFFALVAIISASYWLVDKRNLWSWLHFNNCFTQVDDEAIYDCHICEAMIGESIINQSGHCPRCNARVHKRIPNSLQKTTALIIAAIILYIPANIFPIMTFHTFTGTREDTIFSGVVELIAHGMWAIAVVVFLASIVVPIAKLVILSYLVISVRKNSTSALHHRALLYRITDWVGRWSMIDVYVVTLLTALVQFGILGRVEPGGALIAFAAVVILTMFAAHSFDSRLIWDAQKGPSSSNMSLLNKT